MLRPPSCSRGWAGRCSSSQVTTTSPTRFPARFTRTYLEFEALKAAEPVFESEQIVAVGLNSVRPWRNQTGRVRDEQLSRAGEVLRAAKDGALRVVVLHHHLIAAPWRSRKKPVARRNHVLASLVDAGAELIVAGHIRRAPSPSGASSRSPRAAASALSRCRRRRGSGNRGRTGAARRAASTSTSSTRRTYGCTPTRGATAAGRSRPERVFARGRDPAEPAGPGVNRPDVRSACR